MNKEDNEMIQTPWGKKRWSTIREAFEQRDEMLNALRRLSLASSEANALQHAGLDVPPKVWAEIYNADLDARAIIAKAA